jgi:serine/threonine protein phosphatase PrpC
MARGDTSGFTLLTECAELSLPGNRQKNQDRVKAICDPEALLLIVVDGMGGHAEGERAAELTVGTLTECFLETPRPIFDPQGFLIMALGKAHERVVRLGQSVPIEQRPRATCAVSLVQDGGAYWAHIGDSRVYQLRSGRVRERTRDHSHVELLRREGLIGEQDMKTHPMRNFVECCLGGDAALPDMSVTAQKKLDRGDVLLVCTDGLWSGVEELEIAARFEDGDAPLHRLLQELADSAVARNSPHSDNTSAVALRWRG